MRTNLFLLIVFFAGLGIAFLGWMSSNPILQLIGYAGTFLMSCIIGYLRLRSFTRNLFKELDEEKKSYTSNQ